MTSESISAQDEPSEKDLDASEGVEKHPLGKHPSEKISQKPGKTEADAVKHTDVQETAQRRAYLQETTNAVFFPLFDDTHRYLVLKGGAGSGKSVFAARKLLERALTEPDHRFLVCRKVAKTLWESCAALFREQLLEHYPQISYKFSRSHMTLVLENGSTILFVGLDDTDKLKSIVGITGIWIEEAAEISEADFNQLDIRLRGETAFYKQIILTFNPISVKSWLKSRFFDRKNANCTLCESTYKDNRFLDAEAKKVLEAFRETDEYYYQVYCLGIWGVTGQSVFGSARVMERIRCCEPPLAVGAFLGESGFVSGGDAIVRIYEYPIAGKRYVIGCDTAGTGSDRFAAQVLRADTGEQAALLWCSYDGDIFVKQLFALGFYYNTALVAIEANFDSFPIREMERLGYPNQYVRETFDTFTHLPTESYGFLTTARTRPVIVSGLIAALRGGLSGIRDTDTLDEMLSFVRNESFRPEAAAGAHDDLVMALAIAFYVRQGLSFTDTGSPAFGEHWTEDMWEDYNNASAADRRLLRRKWEAR